MRPILLATALTLALAAPLAASQDSRLPDIGSSAGELLTPARQAEYGGMMLRELRNYGYLLEDPLITDWLQTVGSRLGADSDNPQQAYTFFMMRDRQINAFATLGGYIGMNAGLVLTADREDEMAAVLSHEIAHVTQQHVLRGVERAQRDQVPILLGMLGAIVLAQAAGGSSSGDASQAAIASAMGLMQQRQIDYTRSNESEADRVGIRTLSRAGYDIDAMAGFFAKLQQATRASRGSGREQVPDYLQTHPVTTTRISEARQRADQLRGDQITATTRVPGGEHVERFDRRGITLPESRSDNPLLPIPVTLPTQVFQRGDTGQFDWARERLRALSASTPSAAVREYETLRRQAGKPLTAPQRYGLAIAHLQGGDSRTALTELRRLDDEHPDNLWITLALGEAESRTGDPAAANRRFDALLQRLPQNRPAVLTYAKVLNEQGGREAGQRSQAILRPLMARAGDDPVFQQHFARANELAGDTARAGEAYAEAAYLNGRPEQALIQLQNLKNQGDLDFYARARIDARIATITPEVLELRRQGIRDPDVERR
ncbi:MAG TPA: M48 family metalloprotease [Pseudoxanthomonas sp.]|uniref:M48 family metalloprotease n=1 Tax=Pseudoxanthomonas sp. SE1 TaxID=1664560 RepID=UPI00240E6035|nr:M48 family metalloprotease [Pseudoxanthomonas sp. SE1]WFC43152.1 M48 family metalloprotease [Pseudoxanthomonas sp. SE1]HJS35587.1 M48 family metalloprotease [Pseudoxanthomonas sp.]